MTAAPTDIICPACHGVNGVAGDWFGCAICQGVLRIPPGHLRWESGGLTVLPATVTLPFLFAIVDPDVS